MYIQTALIVSVNRSHPCKYTQYLLDSIGYNNIKEHINLERGDAVEKFVHKKIVRYRGQCKFKYKVDL